MDEAKKRRLERLKKWKAPSNETSQPESAQSQPKLEPAAINLPRKRARLALDGDGGFTTETAPNFEQEPHTDPLESFMQSLDTTGGLVLEDQDTLEVQMRPQVAPLKKGPKIPYVDHKSRVYPEIIKKFYDGTPASIPGVFVSRPLAPITRWADGGFSQQLLDVIAKKNYSKPTPIQSAAFAAIMGGHDVLAIAETGSGKTMAYLLPMLRHVQAQPWTSGNGPTAIVLSPTRELCIQIHHELEPLAKAVNIEACCCYGGSDVKQQIDALKRGTVRVVVATPGRLIDLLAANKGRVLSTVNSSMVVIDEADRMFDLGFSPQLYRIFNTIRRDRQTVLCSATMSSAMQELASKVLTDATRIEAGSSGPSLHIEQTLEIPPDKLGRLRELLDGIKAPDQAIVFTERQDSADNLGESLLRLGYKCRALHGTMSQSDRDEAIQELRAGNLDLLVATSIAARGIDVRTVRLVVNYDPPGHLEDYIHRIGRTGRAGETGKATTFFAAGQYKQAHEIVRAFDPARVPAAILDMASQYTAQPREREGFGGKGLDNLHKTEQAQQTPSGWSIALDINDFPGPLRKRVLSLSVQQELGERYEVTFTTKGRLNKPGDRLRVVIESSQREGVTSAYEDLMAIVEESLEAVPKY